MLSVLLIALAAFLIATVWGLAISLHAADGTRTASLAERLLTPLGLVFEMIMGTLDWCETHRGNAYPVAAGITLLILAGLLRLL